MPSIYCSKQESLLLTSRCSLVFRIRRLLQESSRATSVSPPAFGEDSTVTEHRAGHFATDMSAQVSSPFCQKPRVCGKTVFSIAPKNVALVTGGSRGIGAAIAKRLAADGANVAITYTNGADAAASVVKEIERAGRKAIAIQADAADACAVEAAVEKTVATFGRLDVLVNNAGTAIPKTFEETTLEELDRLIDINVRGTFVT